MSRFPGIVLSVLLSALFLFNTALAADSGTPINPEKTTVGIVLFPGFETLDVYGPLELWSHTPDFEIILIAEESGPVESGQGTQTIATYGFDDAPELDVLMVPGGIGTRQELNNPHLLDYVKTTDQVTDYTTSVCTGSALLAKAGLLNGHRATTNKMAFFLAQQQSKEVDWIVDARWVESGKMFTSSGVSAGMDMALGLVAEIHDMETARSVARTVEYVWQEDANTDPFAQYANLLVESDEGPAFFERAVPAAGATLAEAPSSLRLYFNSTPLAEASNIRLYPLDQPDQAITLRGMHNMSQNDLMIMIDDDLPPGKYTVSWTATFAGGNQLNDSYHFEIIAP